MKLQAEASSIVVFLDFLNCKNVTKLRKAPHMIQVLHQFTKPLNIIFGNDLEIISTFSGASNRPHWC